MAFSQDFAEERLAEEGLAEEGLAEEGLAEEGSAEEGSTGKYSAGEGVCCEPTLPVARDITSAFMTGPCSVRLRRTSPFGDRSGPELAEDHRFQRPHRFEILGCDRALGKHDFELGLDLEHQRDHVHRPQPDVHQMRIRMHVSGDVVRFQYAFDDGKNTAPNFGDRYCHFHFDSVSRRTGDCSVIAATIADSDPGQ
jgi:hypothetical protein